MRGSPSSTVVRQVAAGLGAYDPHLPPREPRREGPSIARPEPEPVSIVDLSDIERRVEQLPQVLPSPSQGRPAMLAEPMQVDQRQAPALGCSKAWIEEEMA